MGARGAAEAGVPKLGAPMEVRRVPGGGGGNVCIFTHPLPPHRESSVSPPPGNVGDKPQQCREWLCLPPMEVTDVVIGHCWVTESPNTVSCIRRQNH